MSLYDEVVAALRSANGYAPEDDRGFSAHLQGVVPALPELRASYRSGFGTVETTYTRAVTEAYLLAYYPHYVRMTWKALGVLRPGDLRSSAEFKLCVFAPGPAPEPVAVGRFLDERFPACRRLEVSLLDRASDEWQRARSVSLDRILPVYWPGTTDLRHAEAIDIVQPGLAARSSNAVARVDLVLFQNCLNELVTDDVQLPRNALELVRSMQPGAVLLMADLVNYPTAVECMNAVARAIDGHVSWIHRPDARLVSAPQSLQMVLPRRPS